MEGVQKLSAAAEWNGGQTARRVRVPLACGYQPNAHRSQGLTFLFLALFSKDFHKYAPSSILSKNRPWSWRHYNWRRGYTSWRHSHWRRGLGPFSTCRWYGCLYGVDVAWARRHGSWRQADWHTCVEEQCKVQTRCAVHPRRGEQCKCMSVVQKATE
jgi:hypothetical protein